MWYCVNTLGWYMCGTMVYVWYYGICGMLWCPAMGKHRFSFNFILMVASLHKQASKQKNVFRRKIADYKVVVRSDRSTFSFF